MIIRYIVTLILLIFLMSPQSNAEKLSLSTFMWEKRLVILAFNNSNLSFLEKTQQFINNNLCEFKDRNLKFVPYQNSINKDYQTPTYIKNQYGFWLVGYDGQVKLHSKELSFLNMFFEEIDTMPMRKDEMSASQKNC